MGLGILFQPPCGPLLLLLRLIWAPAYPIWGLHRLVPAGDENGILQHRFCTVHSPGCDGATPAPSSGASGQGAGEPVLEAPAEPVRSRPGALRPASVYGILVAIRRSDSQKMADMSGGGSPGSRRSGIRPGGCPGDPCLRRRHSFLRGGAGLCLSPGC